MACGMALLFAVTVYLWRDDAQIVDFNNLLDFYRNLIPIHRVMLVNLTYFFFFFCSTSVSIVPHSKDHTKQIKLVY